MSDPLITRADLAAVPELAGWRWVENSIIGGFRAESFTAAAGFALRVAEAADAANHHPDIDVRYPRHARVVLTTHGSGGPTRLDLELAMTITDIAANSGVELDPDTPR